MAVQCAIAVGGRFVLGRGGVRLDPAEDDVVAPRRNAGLRGTDWSWHLEQHRFRQVARGRTGVAAGTAHSDARERDPAPGRRFATRHHRRLEWNEGANKSAAAMVLAT